jgi:hypothetical protein
MATQKQITANRLNALNSTGPRTERGKSSAAHNALKHGFLAHQTVISGETREDFDLHRDHMLAELNPIGPMETLLVDRVIDLSWRLKRANRLQTAAINTMDSNAASNPIAQLTESMRRNADTPIPRDHAIGQLIIKDFSNSKVLERLLMYERRLEHSLYKTILEIQRLKMIRKLVL